MKEPWIFEYADGERPLLNEEIDQISGGCSPSQWPPCDEDDEVYTTGVTCTSDGCSRDSGPD